MGRRLRGGSVLPGFGLSLGFTLLYLGLMILIPLSTVFAGVMNSRTLRSVWAKYLARFFVEIR